MSLEILEKLHLDVETRTIYITDEIDKSSKGRLAIALSFLEKYDADINLYINCPGGCLISSLGMFDLIKSCKNTVNGYVIGEACSGGSIILQACDNRYISKHSSVMIHYGTHGLPSDIPKNNENLLKYYHSLQNDMVKIYKSKMKFNNKKITSKKLAELLNYDTYMRASESKKLGLVDDIKMIPRNSYQYEEDMEVTEEDLNELLKQLGG